AEIFPHAFRALGLGKLVGQATGGFVIGTTATRLIDGSTFRIPRTGVFTNAGVDMERHGVIPDVAVAITPEDWGKGIDTQPPRAVDVVAADVKEWKTKKTGIATRPGSPGGPGGTVPTSPTTAPMPIAPIPKTPLAPSSPIPTTPPAGLIPLAE